MRKNKIVLTICGMEFSILSDDDIDYVKATGREVDEKIKALIDDNNRLSVAMAAIVAALDYCDELQKNNTSIDNLRAEIKQYLEESAEYRKDAEDARREVERLKREIQVLRQRIGEKDTRKTSAQAAQLPTPPAISNVPKATNAAANEYKTLDGVRQPAPAPAQHVTSTGRKPRLYGKDAYAESADVTQEIMKFFGESEDEN